MTKISDKVSEYRFGKMIRRMAKVDSSTLMEIFTMMVSGKIELKHVIYNHLNGARYEGSWNEDKLE
jgi:hypothetical protein